jgi:putative oxidoreductase
MSDHALLILRLAAGLGLASHGYVAIVDGGVDAIENFADYLESLDLPAPLILAWAAKITELAGGTLVALGFITRPAAFMCAATMLVAMLTAHLGDPLTKWELALLYFASMSVISMCGAGRYSLDAKRRH